MEFINHLPVGIHLVLHSDVDNASYLWQLSKYMYMPGLNFVSWPDHICDDTCVNLGLVMVESREFVNELETGLYTIDDVHDAYSMSYEKMPYVTEASSLDVLAGVACMLRG